MSSSRRGIVVGKVDLQTPIFSDEIEQIVVNPAWNVPPSIIAKEYLPLLRNGGVPEGFQVFARVGGRFRPVDPWMINWSSVAAKDLQFRQPPGERNALGVIKFNFPNKYAVYLHDTPAKALFQNSLPRLQPRLHAGAGSLGARRGASHPRARLERRIAEEDGRRAGKGGSAPQQEFRCTSPTSPLGSTRPARCRFAMTSTAMIAASSRCSG